MDKRNETFTKDEVAIYATIAFHNLNKTGNLKITEDDFYYYILTLIDLHTKEKIKEIYEKVKQV